MRGPGESREHVAAANPARGADELLAGDRVVDREDRRQLLDVELHRLLRRSQRVAIRADKQRHRLADEAAKLLRENLLVVEDRPERVVERHILMRPRGDDAGNPARAQRRDRSARIRPCGDRISCRRNRRGPRQFCARRHAVVDVRRLPGDVQPGRVVRMRFAEDAHDILVLLPVVGDPSGPADESSNPRGCCPRKWC